MDIIIPVLILVGIAVIETFIATLDVISIMRRKLLLNFVMVFGGAFLSLVVIRYIVHDPDNWIVMAAYSLAAGLTSVITIHYDSVLRKKRSAKKTAARKLDLTYTGNVGECK